MFKSIAFSASVIGLAAVAGAAVNTAQMLAEERMAHQEEAHIIRQPIAGIENHFWFDYRTDIAEAKHELASDLNRATDTEDLRGAWDEYRGELADGRHDYVKEMAERGYRYPDVRIVD